MSPVSFSQTPCPVYQEFWEFCPPNTSGSNYFSPPCLSLRDLSHGVSCLDDGDSISRLLPTSQSRQANPSERKPDHAMLLFPTPSPHVLRPPPATLPSSPVLECSPTAAHLVPSFMPPTLGFHSDVPWALGPQSGQPGSHRRRVWLVWLELQRKKNAPQGKTSQDNPQASSCSHTLHSLLH